MLRPHERAKDNFWCSLELTIFLLAQTLLRIADRIGHRQISFAPSNQVKNVPRPFLILCLLFTLCESLHPFQSSIFREAEILFRQKIRVLLYSTSMLRANKWNVVHFYCEDICASWLGYQHTFLIFFMNVWKCFTPKQAQSRIIWQGCKQCHYRCPHLNFKFTARLYWSSACLIDSASKLLSIIACSAIQYASPGSILSILPTNPLD